MKALTTAIYAKASGSAFSTAIGGRLYKGRAPDGAVYPYVVYMVISETPDPTFSDDLENVLVQFSIFSSASSSGEAEDIYALLCALYDNCALTITGETMIYMQRQVATPMVEDHVTVSGTLEVWHYAVDYAVLTRVT